MELCGDPGEEHPCGLGVGRQVQGLWGLSTKKEIQLGEEPGKESDGNPPGATNRSWKESSVRQRHAGPRLAWAV